MNFKQGTYSPGELDNDSMVTGVGVRHRIWRQTASMVVTSTKSRGILSGHLDSISAMLGKAYSFTIASKSLFGNSFCILRYVRIILNLSHKGEYLTGNFCEILKFSVMLLT